MRVRTCLAFIGIVSLIIVLLANMPQLTACPSDRLPHENERTFSAVRVDVRPWQGRHETYGTFHVPAQYANNDLYTAWLNLSWLSEKFDDIAPEPFPSIVIDPKEEAYYSKLVYFPTRTALWFLLTGRFGDLNSPCHWQLTISEKSKQSNG